MKYQIFTHHEQESEVEPFTAEMFDDPIVAIEAVRQLRRQLNFTPQTMLLVKDEEENLIHQNFLQNGAVREWTRPGIMRQL